MHAPLARHLARFGDPVALHHPVPAAVEPQVTLGVAELEARIEAASRRARDEAQTAAEQAVAAARSEYDAALDAAARDAAATLAQARTEWAAARGAELAAGIDEAFATLAARLSDGLAAALRPLVRTAVMERAAAQLADALASVLGDPSDPPLVVRGPANLLAALEAARGTRQGLDLQESESGELVVTAGGAHLETRLTAALATLAQEMA